MGHSGGYEYNKCGMPVRSSGNGPQVNLKRQHNNKQRHNKGNKGKAEE